MDNAIATAKGLNGQLELLKDRVIIRRKGFMSFMTQGLKGDKEILLSGISAVQFKKGSFVANGYIQFTMAGGNEGNKGLLQAPKDENTVMFQKKRNDEFETFKQAVDQARATSTQSGQPVASDADELRKFAELHKQGILSGEEFAAKKKQLLGIE